MNELIKVIKEEIKWCKENPNQKLSFDYQEGFVAGLKQSINLIRQLEDNNE